MFRIIIFILLSSDFPLLANAHTVTSPSETMSKKSETENEIIKTRNRTEKSPFARTLENHIPIRKCVLIAARAVSYFPFNLCWLVCVLPLLLRMMWRINLFVVFNGFNRKLHDKNVIYLLIATESVVCMVSTAGGSGCTATDSLLRAAIFIFGMLLIAREEKMMMMI